jgi:hypothetical protein
MRKYPTDYWLWGLVSGGMFALILGVWIFAENLLRDRLDRIMSETLILAGACAIIGWIVHALAVICGVRLSGRPDPEQASDYRDDLTTAPPTA